MKNKETYETYLSIYSNYKRMMVELTSNIVSYEVGWSDEFSRSEIKKLYGKLIKEFTDVDFTSFSITELKSLDFKWFDENIICMPIWAIDCLQDKTEIATISGDIIVFDKSKSLDKDVRFGVTAYGFLKSQLRDAAIDNILN